MENERFLYALPVWAKGLSGAMNTACYFCAVFPKRENALLRVTASSFYRVFLNGKLIGYGPARAPHRFFRIDEYLLAELKEENRITIEAAGYNCNSFYALNQPAFLQAEILFAGGAIATGSARDFRCTLNTERIRRSPRYSYQRAFTECYDFSANPAERYNANMRNLEETPAEVVLSGKLLSRGVSYPLFREDEAHFAEYGSLHAVPDAKVYENRCLLQSGIGLYPLEELDCNPNERLSLLGFSLKKPTNFCGRLKDSEYAVYDLGKVKSGFIGFQAEAERDSLVYIVFDEADSRGETIPDEPMKISYNRNDCLNFISCKLARGNCEFLSFEPYSLKYIKVIVLEGRIKLHRVYLKEYENPDTEGFCFGCADSELKEIVLAARNTFCQNAVDIPTDCPGRERAGWLCDGYFISLAEKLFTGKNLVERNFLQNYALSGRAAGLPEGMVGMCWPADFEDNTYIPNWALWYILELESYFVRTKDRALVEDSKKIVYDLLSYFKKFLNGEGLLENLEGWIFIEWSRAGDKDFVRGVNFPTNMLYALILEKAALLYGDRSCFRQAERVREAIRLYSYDGKFFVDNAVRGNGKLVLTKNISETCQYYAFFSKTATAEKYPRLWENLLHFFGPERNSRAVYPHVCNSVVFIGYYLRLMILLENKLYDQCLKECKRLFLPMAQRTGTLWEHGELTASLNHGFAAFAGNLILDCLQKMNC